MGNRLAPVWAAQKKRRKLQLQQVRLQVFQQLNLQPEGGHSWRGLALICGYSISETMIGSQAERLVRKFLRSSQKQQITKVVTIQRKEAKVVQKRYIPPNEFYASDEWRAVRYEAIKQHGARCQCCGRSPKKHNVVIHVDHIKPRSKYPDLQLEVDNLQVLCEDCNLGKMARDATDWR